MRRNRLKNNLGYTLIELLVVMGIMGLVALSMFSLYRNTGRSASTTEEVIEVQQNLRIALEQMKKDVRMAGFLVPGGNSISVAPSGSLDANGDGDCDDAGDVGPCFTLRTASSLGVAGRISASTIIDVTNDLQTEVFTFPMAGMVDLFTVGQTVRLLRPEDGSAVVADTASGTVSAVDRTGPTVTLQGLLEYGSPVNQVIESGDVLVAVPAGTTHPNTIQYYLQDDPDSADPAMRVLVRDNGASAEVLASKVSDLGFIYILDDGTETTAPAAAELSEIRAVRIILDGQTDATLTGQANFSGVKARRAVGVVSLRNR